MKRRLFTILIAAMLLTMTACDTSQSNVQSPQASPSAGQTHGAAPSATGDHEPVTLRIYARYSDDDTIKPYDYAVAALSEAMPWVTLELDEMPADDGVKLKTYAATGDMPDIFGISGSSIIDSLITSGSIADVTKEITENGFLDKVIPGAYSKLYYTDDNIYTIPYTGAEVALLFVNKAIFEENSVPIPTTIDELADAAKVLSEKGVTVLPIFGKEQWICITLYDMLVTRYITDGVGSLHSGEHSVREEGYLLAAQDLANLTAAGAFPAGVTSLNYEQATSLWYEGRAAMFVNGQWEIAASTEHLGNDADWIPIPAAKAEDYETSQYAFTGGKGSPGGFAVCPYSKNYNIAVDVACFLAEKFAEYNYSQRGIVTVAVEVEKEMEIESPAMMQKLADYFPKITSTTTLGGSGNNAELYTVLGESCQSLMAGTSTPEQFIESIALVTGD